MSKLRCFLVCLFSISASGQGITQVATLPVSTAFPITGQPLNGISSAFWNTKRNELYISYTNTIQVYDTSKGDPTQWSLKTTVQLGFSAMAMDLSKDGLLAIANQQTDIVKGTKSVTLVNPADGFSQRTISLGDYTGTMTCAFSPDGKSLYVEAVRQVSPFQLSVYAVDVASGQVFQTWRAAGNNVLTLQGTPDGKVWGIAENEVPAPNITTNMLAVYNPDGSESAPDLGGLLPRHLFISPDGMTAYVSGIIQIGSNPYYSTSTVAISTADETVIGSSGTEPSFLAWPSQDVLYAYAIEITLVGAVTLSGTIQWQKPTTPLNSQLVTHGLLANRQANGSDLLVLLRDGGLDVYTATQPPLIYSVVNGASFQAVPLAPGENITVFGSALGYVGQADSTGLQILTQMGATSVLLDGKPLRVNYVGYGQINAYMPQSVSNGTHSLSVKVGAASTANQQVTVADQNLGLFQFVPDPVKAPGVEFPILMDAGYHILGDPTVPNPESQPSGYAQVSRGDTAIAWATGGGLTNPPISDSDVSPGGLHPLVVTPAMTACGVPVALSYSGRAPSFPSLDQFNFVVPGVCQSGANDLTLGLQRYKGALWVK
jgi:uncharacterized protein (TIGR03437 family)